MLDAYSQFNDKKDNYKFLFSLFRRLHSDCALQVNEATRELSYTCVYLCPEERNDFFELQAIVRRLVLSIKRPMTHKTLNQIRIGIYTAEYKDISK
ncbi:MAG: hypothetical protein COB83_08105 [Gammaproteobacteria bacterium]|nr:MAG: hypothetical protein COB83_08105 [Gammaproteobacteria bacterium]